MHLTKEESWWLAVQKSNFNVTRFVRNPVPLQGTLAPGLILVEVERIAMSANNIIYATQADFLRSWDHFQVDGSGGVVPAWGYGTVVESGHPQIAVGERLIGFFPMGSHALLQPVDITPGRFADGASHRQLAKAPYREYRRITGNASFEGSLGNYMLLTSPLLLTSWLAAQYFAENGFFGASDLLITSASSKTSMALAHVLRRAGATIRTIGLTSGANFSFVSQLGLYDQVFSYVSMDVLDTGRRAILYDIAGNAAIKRAIHAAYDSQLVHSAQVGFAHWDAAKSDEPLPGPTPQLFFAAAQLVALREREGDAALASRRQAASLDFAAFLMESVQIQESAAPAEIEQVYRAVLGGRVPANLAHVLVMTTRTR